MPIFQTLTEVAGDESSTIVLPLPMDLLEPMLKIGGDKSEPEA